MGGRNESPQAVGRALSVGPLASRFHQRAHVARPGEGPAAGDDIGRRDSTDAGEKEAFRVRDSRHDARSARAFFLLPSRVGQFPSNSAVEGGFVGLSVRLEGERRQLDRVENVTKVQAGHVGDAVVAHFWSGASSGPSTWTTIAVMLSSPPRPFASEISEWTFRSGSARDISSV